MQNPWAERVRELEELYETTARELETVKKENAQLKEVLAANSVLLKDRCEVISAQAELIAILQTRW